MQRSLTRYIPVLLIAVAAIVALGIVLGSTSSDSEPSSSSQPAAGTADANDKDAKGDGPPAPADSSPITPPSELPGAKPFDGPVPILMYHVIAEPPPGAPYPELYVSKEEFAAQMQELKRSGYHAVTLANVFDAWDDGAKLPPKPIVLTFDDGYLSDAKNAAPVLRSLRWPGVLNFSTKNLKEEWGLSAKRVRELLAGGWELDDHTIDHLDLTTLDAAELERQVSDSRDLLQKRFGVEVEFFCYPAGRYDDTVIAAVKDAGYRGATTTVEGLASPDAPFELKRVRVNGGDGASGLMEALRAAQSGQSGGDASADGFG